MTLNAALYRVISFVHYVCALCVPWRNTKASEFSQNVIKNVIHFRDASQELVLVEDMRHSLKKDQQQLQITNLGASGPVYFSRNVSDIVRQSIINNTYGALLFRVVQHCNAKNILELGTSLGISSSYMAVANRQARIVSVEGCPSVSDFARKLHKQHGIQNIEVVNAPFDDVLQELLKTKGPFDFVYLDGNHSYEATRRYVNAIVQYRVPKLVMILDDIHWSKGMEQAWSEIIKSPEVRLSMDLYQMGILFFDPDLRKEDCVVCVKGV